MSDTDELEDDPVFSQSVTVTEGEQNSQTPTPTGSMAFLPKPKRWFYSESEGFFMDICIRTCLEIHETGTTFALPTIHSMIVEGWHKRFFFFVVNATTHPLASLRYFDKCLEESHPMPYRLQHPSEVWKHTAFQNQAEYNSFQSAPQKLGRPSATNPLGELFLDFRTRFTLLCRWNETELP